MKMNVVCLPYNVEGKGIRGGAGPQSIVNSNLFEEIQKQGNEIKSIKTVQMPKEDEEQYGGWNRVGLSGKHLAHAVSALRGDDDFILGLLADCNGVLGMLGGLQNPKKATEPIRVGLVWIDAHGDYNTPETSPSGMLGGMPVAIAAGKALHRLRQQSDIKIPLQSPDIKMAGMRDLDRIEEKAIKADGLEVIREKDLVECSDRINQIMDKLSAREDIIYIHIDLDILDPAVAPAAGLPSPNGLTGEQLGDALQIMMSYPKVAALAIASYRAEDDKEEKTMEEIKKAVLGGTKSLVAR